uniref:TIL domain-containing protein n=1 Tax=Panagrolaimus sp. PS1159 TaxID=55785 RepID=A0AC35GTN1_9BILA
MYDTAPCTHKCQQPACTCADNFVRINGECIHWSHCPQLEQKVLKPVDDEDETTPASTTITHSPPTAPVTWSSSSSSAPSSASGERVTVEETFKCAPNETVNECGRICEADCTTIFVRDECNECGKEPACACVQGYARNGAGCVYWGDCPLDSGLQTVAPKTTIKQLIAETRPTTTTVAPTTKPKSAERRTSSIEATTFAIAESVDDEIKTESS